MAEINAPVYLRFLGSVLQKANKQIHNEGEKSQVDAEVRSLAFSHL